MPYTLQQHIAFNHWANEQMIQLIQEQPEAILKQSATSSFPGIYATLLHLWDADSMWLQRLKGVNPAIRPSASFKGDSSTLFQNLLKTSGELVAHVNTLDERSLQGKLSYTSSAGEQVEVSLAGIIFHVVNHSTYHRGQLVTLLRQAGVTHQLPATDIALYLFQNNL